MQTYSPVLPAETTVSREWNQLLQPTKSLISPGTSVVSDKRGRTLEILDEFQSQRVVYEPPVSAAIVNRPKASSDASVIQVWEGTVLNTDLEHQTMNVLLNAKMGNVASHTGQIDLEWVSEQDRDLLSPGAIFYLTLFKRTKRGGTVENTQELRFRRLPSWSKPQLENVKRDAEMLLSKMKARPRAE